jgi:hypothetical protein
MTKKQNQAIKAGKLAASAEGIGNMEEALTAGRRAGELAASSELSLDSLWDNLRGAIEDAPTAWGAMVDGWHDVTDVLRRTAVADWLAQLGCPTSAVEDVRSGRKPIPPHLMG